RERGCRDEDRDEHGDAGDDDGADVGIGVAAERVTDRDGERAEERAGERRIEDGGHVLRSAGGGPGAHAADHRARVRRALVGGCALGLATGWNISNTGAIATQLSHAYGVGLATIGLFTTALFTTHLIAQIPGGRASDHFGARRTGLLALG